MGNEYIRKNACGFVKIIYINNMLKHAGCVNKIVGFLIGVFSYLHG